MSLPIEEQETHVNFNRDDERATVYTSDTTMMTKLNKLIELPGTEWKLESEYRLQKSNELIGKTYSCPIRFISFRTKDIVRNMSEEQKEKAREQMKRLNVLKQR